MSHGMCDAQCPKCKKRYGWHGRIADGPPCPRCGHVVDRSADQRTIDQLFKCLALDDIELVNQLIATDDAKEYLDHLNQCATLIKGGNDLDEVVRDRLQTVWQKCYP